MIRSLHTDLAIIATYTCDYEDIYHLTTLNELIFELYSMFRVQNYCCKQLLLFHIDIAS